MRRIETEVGVSQNSDHDFETMRTAGFSRDSRDVLWCRTRKQRWEWDSKPAVKGLDLILTIYCWWFRSIGECVGQGPANKNSKYFWEVYGIYMEGKLKNETTNDNKKSKWSLRIVLINDVDLPICNSQRRPRVFACPAFGRLLLSMSSHPWLLSWPLSYAVARLERASFGAPMEGHKHSIPKSWWSWGHGMGQNSQGLPYWLCHSEKSEKWLRGFPLKNHQLKPCGYWIGCAASALLNGAGPIDWNRRSQWMLPNGQHFKNV